MLTFTLFADHLMAWKTGFNVEYYENYNAINISDELWRWAKMIMLMLSAAIKHN